MFGFGTLMEFSPQYLVLIPPLFISISQILAGFTSLLICISVILMWSNGITFSSMKDLIADKKNPLGIIIRFFGIYLVFAFPVNFIIMIIYGSEASLLFPVNFALLLPFAIWGFIKGLLAFRK